MNRPVAWLHAAALMAAGLTSVQAATVAIDPPVVTVAGPGADFSVLVSGSGFVTDLDGGGLTLEFDPTVLQVVDVLIDGTAWDFATDKGLIDNTAGSVTGSSFNQFAHPKTGSFDILEYRFEALATGTSPLALTGFAGNPFASGGAEVQVEFQGGVVTVVPEPSSMALMTAGVLLGVAARRRLVRSKDASPEGR